jgi:hypothetical protein
MKLCFSRLRTRKRLAKKREAVEQVEVMKQVMKMVREHLTSMNLIRMINMEVFYKKTWIELLVECKLLSYLI